MHICAEVLDVQPDELIFKFAGLNHFHWHRVWDKYGNERTEEIIEKLYHPEKKVEIKDSGVANIKDIQFNYEQIEDLGILPCPYHRYYYSTDDMLKDELEEFKKGETRAEVVKRTEAELFEL